MPPVATPWMVSRQLYTYQIDGDFFDRLQVLELQDALEAIAHEVHALSARELVSAAKGRETVSAMYDVVVAAQIFTDALARTANPYRDTLYELFNLEEAVRIAELSMTSAPLSSTARNNFAEIKYYVSELLWQYRLDIAAAVKPAAAKKAVVRKRS